MSTTSGFAGNSGDEPPCITSPLKSYPRESTVLYKEGESDRINSINGSGDATTGLGSPRRPENERPLSRSPRRRSPKRRSRSRSPKRRSRSRSPVSRAKMCDEADDWEKNECVILDSYNCDLNMIINSSNCGAKPQTDGGFSMMWAGVRASYGFIEGKVFYEVRVLENIGVDNLDSFAGGATHVVRVGWSTEDSLFALGEEHNSFGYGGTGKKSCDNKFTDYGCTFSEGDVVGAFLENTENEAIMRFSVNGVDQGECYRVNKASLGTKKALFPHIYVKNVEFSVNFGHDDIEPWFVPNIPGDDSATWHQLNQTSLSTRVRGRLPPSSKAECDVIMMIGLPGAGKTYYADKFSNENREKQYNVLGTNFILDRMKVMGLARQRNYAGRWDVLIDKATKCLNVLINVASNRRRNYILDQTNVYPSAQRRKMRPFEGFKRRAIVIVPTDEEFRRRITQREKEEGKEVPESAVLEMKANFGIPKALSEDSTSVFDEVEFTELDASAASTLVERYNEEGQAGRPPAEKRQRWESRDRDSGDSRWGGGGFDRDRSRDFSRGRRDGFSRSPRRDDRGRRDYRGGYSAQRDGREDRFDRGRDRDSYGRGRFGGGGGAPSGRFGGPQPPRGGGYAPNMRGGGYGGGFDGGMGRGGMNRGGGNYGYGYDMNRGPPVDFRGGPRGGRGGYHGGGGSMDPMYRGGPTSYGGPGGANEQSYEAAAFTGYSSHSGRAGPMDSQTSGRGTAPPPSRGMGAPGRGAPPVGRGGGGGPGGSRGSQDPYGGGAVGYPSAANYPLGGRSQFPGQGESYSGGNQQKAGGGGGYSARTGYSEGGYHKGAYPDEYSSASVSGFSSAGGYAEGAYPPGTNPPSSYPPQESYSNASGTRGGRAAPIPPSGMFGGAGESIEGAKSVRSGGQSAENQAVEGVNQHTSSASRFGGDRQGGARQSRFDDVKAPSAQSMYQQQNPYSYPSSGYQSAYNAGGYGSSTVAPPGKGAPPANQPPPSKSNRSQFEPVPPTVSPVPLSQQSMATQGYGYGYQQSKPESTNQAPVKQPQPSGGVNPAANYNSAYGYGYTYGGYGGSGAGATAPIGASRTPPSAASANTAGSASLYASAVADKTTTQAQSMAGSNAAQKQAAASSGAASAASMAYASYYGYGQAGVQPPHPSAGVQAAQQQQQQYSAWQQSTGGATAAAPAAAASVPTTTTAAGGQAAAAAAAAAASAYSSYYAAYPGFASAGAYGRPSGGTSAGSTAPTQQQPQQPQQQQQQQQYYAGYR